MVTGAIAPAAMATGPPDPPGSSINAPDTGGVEGVTGDEKWGTAGDYDTALEHRDAAQTALRESDDNANVIDRLLDDLDGTYAFVLDENRVDSRAGFHIDRKLVAQTQQREPAVAAYLTAADAHLAATSIADAERVADQLAARNVSYDEAAVRDDIADARDAFETAVEYHENDRLVAAVVEYERAWVDSQRALARMDRAVDPIVEITHREDPPHEGNFTYPVQGVVYDVHTANLNATVSVNGEEYELELAGSTVPGEAVTFNDTIVLEEQVNTVTVTAVNPEGTFVDLDATSAAADRPSGEQSDGTDRGNGKGNGNGNSAGNGNGNNANNGNGNNAGNGNGNGAGSTGDTSSDLAIEQPQQGSNDLYLDADGLPDWYELEVTGTDPLNSDSNSTFTDANESDRGLLDGQKDLDGDGLMAYQEFRIGTDPLDPDTSSDGLEDGWQVYVSGTDPLVNDSFDDGVLDRDRDFSGDGLTLLEEQAHGTNPHVTDTDGDGLTDYEEIHVYGTDPLDPDTSGDGLTDGEKVRLGLDPLANDTTPDGTPASEQTFTTETTDEDSGVTVTATGQGVVADGIHVTNVSDESEVDDPVVGPTVRITNDTAFESATVELPIEEPIDDADNLTIFKWDPSTDDGWEPVDTTVDETNRTATATVDSFSYIAPVYTDGTGKSGSWRVTESPEWPVLEDFQTLEGWTADGDVDRVNGVVEMGSDYEGDDSDHIAPTEFDILDIPTCDDYPDLDNCIPTDGDDEDSDGDDSDGDDSDGDDSDDDDSDGDDSDDDDSDSDDSDDDDSDGDDSDDDDSDSDDSDDDDSDGDDSDDDDSDSDDSDDDDPEAVPTISTLERTVSLSEAETIHFNTRLRGTGDAEIRLIGEDRTKTIPSHTIWQIKTHDVSDFAGQEVTVQLRAENGGELGVDYVSFLEDTADTGIPDEVQKMPLRMRNGPPGVVWSPLDLDPTVADSSGDGLTDAEVLDLDWNFVESDRGDGAWDFKAEVNSAIAHPARNDTTGDGLTDRQQLEGWEIHVVDDHGEAKEMMEALTDPDDNRDLGKFFTEPTVYANPLVNDSSGDGLSDAEELELGTDPQVKDTTGDRISDRDALELGEDPTVFDVSPPEITVYHASYHKPRFSFTTEYHLSYVLKDAAGLERVVVRKDGDRKISDEYHGLIQEDYRSDSFETKFGDTVLDVYGGAKVTVEAEDRNGNVAQEVALSRTDIFGEIASDLGSETIFDERIAGELGTFSGFSTGASETGEVLQAIYDDPVGFLSAIREIIGVLRDLGVLAQLIESLPDQVEQQQELNNPYNPHTDPEMHASYRQGWYEGYIAYVVLEMAMPVGEVGNAVKSSSRLNNAVDQLDRTGDLRRAAQYAGRAKHTATAPARYTGQHLSSGLARTSDLTRTTAERVLSPLRTSGQQYTVAKLLHRHDIDGQDLNRLSPDEQQRLGQQVARHGDGGARLVADGGGDALQLLVRADALDAATTDRLLRAYDRGTIDNADLQRIARGLDEGVIDQGAVRTALTQANKLEANGHEIVQFQTGQRLNDQNPSHYKPVPREILSP